MGNRREERSHSRRREESTPLCLQNDISVLFASLFCPPGMNCCFVCRDFAVEDRSSSRIDRLQAGTIAPEEIIVKRAVSRSKRPGRRRSEFHLKLCKQIFYSGATSSHRSRSVGARFTEKRLLVRFARPDSSSCLDGARLLLAKL